MPSYSESIATLKNCDNNKKGLLMHIENVGCKFKGTECIPKVDWDIKSKGFKHGGDFS
jgi:hypothetical protein